MAMRLLFPLLTVVCSVCAFADEHHIEEPGLRRIVASFNQAIETKDWDTAEAIASCAADELGAKHLLAIVMTQNAKLAKGLERLSLNEPSGNIQLLNSPDSFSVNVYLTRQLPARFRLGDGEDARELESHVRGGMGDMRSGHVRSIPEAFMIQTNAR